MDVFMNFSSGVLSANPGAAGTTLQSGNFAFLPAVAAPFTMRLALDPDGIAGVPEIAIVTAHVAFSTSVTVLRGQESAFGAGPARAHAVDSTWRHVLTRASLLELAVQPATIQATAASTADPGFALLDGSTIVNGQVLYPLTWARVPAAWKAAPDLILPDARGATLMMNDAGAVFTLGELGGSNTKVIAVANLPAAGVSIDPPALSIDPPNTAVTIVDPGHIHRVSLGSGAPSEYDYMINSGGATITGTPLPLTTTGITASVDIAPFNVDQAPFQSANLGTATPLDVVPANLCVNWQIKLT